MATFANTSAILDAIAVRIAALTPDVQADGQAAEDDVFRCTIGLKSLVNNSRAVNLQGNAGIRKLPARDCRMWQTTVNIETYYSDVATAADQPTVYQRAIIDAEYILDDLYDWAANAPVTIFPQEAQISDVGDGEIVSNRVILIEYKRT